MKATQLTLVILLAIIIPLAGQELRPPEKGGFTESLGQPEVYRPYLGVSLGSYRPSDQKALSAQFRLGVFRYIGNPVVALLGISAEGYVGNRDSDHDGGFRGMLALPALHLAGGVDYNLKDNEADFMLRLKLNIRRGGIFGRGTDLRLEWLPGRGNTYNIGLGIPIFQPNKGKTRPVNTHVDLPKPSLAEVPFRNTEPSLQEALANIRESAHWVNRLTTPYFDQSGKDPYKAIRAEMSEIQHHLNSTGPLFPQGRSSEAEVRFYHMELDRAFSIAILGKALAAGESMPEGRTVASQAKEILFQEVLIPYDRLLGQIKKPDTIREYALLARGAMARWLVNSSVVPDERVDAVRYVFAELLDIIEENRKYSHEEWGDSRLVWLPLQYALLPEQHDTQAELDTIIERCLGRNFTDTNRIWYVINEQFQWEVSRQIRAARDYHVLWIHDIQAFNASGKPDSLSFLQVYHSYMGAMVERIKEYDKTGKFPVYMLFMDQHYYELHQSRRWLRILEKPLTYKISISDKAMENSLIRRQKELREAIAASKLLQSEIQEYGEAWLYNLVKLHINITNPSDLSFFSSQIIPLIGIPDNMMRDHRKISFYDITEEDPYKGEALYSGMGIGEHYVGPSWEDRGILVQGPAALDLKYAARQLLLNQGFQERDIPYPLQIKEKPANYEAMVAEVLQAWRAGGGENLARVLQAHNQTGYRPKPIDVLKAILYSLMPKGSLILIPDSLWNGTFLASLLVGNVLRGVQASLTAPSLACAPGTGFPQMSRAQELFARLIAIQDLLKEEIASAGGALRTTMYDPEVDVADVPGIVKEFRKRLKSDPLIQKTFNFHPSFYVMLDSMDIFLKDFKPGYLSPGAEIHRPKLHMKMNFFVSFQAWNKLMSRPEFTEVFRTYILQRARQVEAGGVARDVKEEARAILTPARKWFQAQYAEEGPEVREEAVYYLLVGSSNQDYRSMLMDGEVAVAVSNEYSMYGFLDLLFKVGLSKPVGTLEELGKYLPAYNGFQRAVGRMMKTAL